MVWALPFWVDWSAKSWGAPLVPPGPLSLHMSIVNILWTNFFLKWILWHRYSLCMYLFQIIFLFRYITMKSFKSLISQLWWPSLTYLVWMTGSKSAKKLLKVSKSQEHFFLETPLPKKQTKYIYDNILLYEARAEFYLIFRLFFGKWSFKIFFIFIDLCESRFFVTIFFDLVKVTFSTY